MILLQPAVGQLVPGVLRQQGVIICIRNNQGNIRIIRAVVLALSVALSIDPLLVLRRFYFEILASLKTLRPQARLISSLRSLDLGHFEILFPGLGEIRPTR